MGALTALFEALAAKSAEGAGGKAVDAVGNTFMRGAELPGTFQRGKEFAKTPEGLAAQFDWSVPQRRSDGVTIYKDPNSDANVYLFAQNYAELLKKDAELRKRLGLQEGTTYSPFIDRGDLPQDATYYTIGAGRLAQGSGAGTRAYPAIYGDILNNPNAVNIKDGLTGVNEYRNNYNLASAIMRRPDAGERLLTSPEQFRNVLADPAALRTAAPETQVGALQTEGALQTLQRLLAATTDKATPEALRARLGNLTFSSDMSPADLNAAYAAVKASNSAALKSTGPGALRKLGITSDALQGRDVNPAAFKGLEFSHGGALRKTSPAASVRRGGVQRR